MKAGKKEITLREFREGNYKEGWVISQRGAVRVTSVNQDWWINCPDLNGGNGQSFSLTPSDTIYIH